MNGGSDRQRIEKLLREARVRAPAEGIVMCADDSGELHECTVSEMIEAGWDFKRMVKGHTRDVARITAYLAPPNCVI